MKEKDLIMICIGNICKLYNRDDWIKEQLAEMSRDNPDLASFIGSDPQELIGDFSHTLPDSNEE